MQKLAWIFVLAVIIVASSKGGVGKTTTALAIAQILAERGDSIGLLDCDSNTPLMRWAARDRSKIPPVLSVVDATAEGAARRTIEEVASVSQHVVIDTPGNAAALAGDLLLSADLVIVPLRGSQLDADEAARVVGMVRRQERALRRVIKVGLLFTCTSAALRTRDLVHLRNEFRNGGVHVFEAELIERAAFRAFLQFGGTLKDLTTAEAPNPEAAHENAVALVDEILKFLRRND